SVPAQAGAARRALNTTEEIERAIAAGASRCTLLHGRARRPAYIRQTPRRPHPQGAPPRPPAQRRTRQAAPRRPPSASPEAPARGPAYLSARARRPCHGGRAQCARELRSTLGIRYAQARGAPQPPSRSTEKSWLHFRPPPVDFCGPRLAIGAA